MPFPFTTRTLLALALLTLSGRLHAQSFFATELPNSPGAMQQQAAEASASVTGEVNDSHDALVPGAVIRAVEKTTGASHESIADTAAKFDLKLPPGSYTVTVSAAGFKTFIAPRVILKPGEHFLIPGIVLPIAQQAADVTVTVTTYELAQQELRDEERQRVLAIFPNFYTSYLWNAAPLTAGQKFQLGIRSVTDPVSFIAPLIVAGAEQANDTYPSWNTDTAGYAKRYAASYGDALFGRLLGSSVFPTIFRQDPRYFFMGPNYSNAKRAKHALLSGLVARGDNGHNQPNFAHILGNASAGALSTVYHPARDTGPGQLAYTNALIGIGGEGVVALLREFLWVHATRNLPPYMHGKPAPVNADPNP